VHLRVAVSQAKWGAGGGCTQLDLQLAIEGKIPLCCPTHLKSTHANFGVGGGLTQPALQLFRVEKLPPACSMHVNVAEHANFGGGGGDWHFALQACWVRNDPFVP
jgi:hypothetical protein